MKKITQRAIAPFIALLLAFFSAQALSIEEGYPVPNFDLQTLTNGGGESTIKLSDYRGKVVMLDFWGDW